MVAGTEMTVAEFLTVEGDAAEINALILQRVKKATDPPFSRIKKAEVLTAIDHLITTGLILRPANQI